MTSYQRLMARIALIRERIDGGPPARLPNWRNKPKKPPTGGGETRSRAPDVGSTAKPPDAAGQGPIPSPAPAAAVPRFKKQCTAVDGVTGRRCGLLEHSDVTPHRSERGAFTVLAVPGQRRFELHEELETFSTRNPEDFDAKSPRRS